MDFTGIVIAFTSPHYHVAADGARALFERLGRRAPPMRRSRHHQARLTNESLLSKTIIIQPSLTLKSTSMVDFHQSMKQFKPLLNDSIGSDQTLQ